MLRERLPGRRAARLVSGSVCIGAGLISWEKAHFGFVGIFISRAAGPADSLNPVNEIIITKKCEKVF